MQKTQTFIFQKGGRATIIVDFSTSRITLAITNGYDVLEFDLSRREAKDVGGALRRGGLSVAPRG